MSDIYLQITETPTVVTLSAPVISGALSSTVTVANTVTVALDSNSLSALENVTVTVGAAVSISNFPASQAVTFSAVTISNFPATQPVSIASVTIGNTVTIAGTVTANPTGTQTIAGTVTIGAGTSQIGSVTASISNSVTIASLPAISGTVTVGSLPNSLSIVNSSSVTKSNVQYTAIAGSINTSDGSSTYTMRPIAVNSSGQIYIDAIVNAQSVFSYDSQSHIRIRPTNDSTVTIGSLPALVAGTAQIGSVTASISNSVTIASLPAISGTVTANTFALQGTAVTTSNFTSSTASTVLAGYNATREVLTIFNEGAGNLHVCAGATCTTIAYQVRLSSGDYYEVPNHQTTITHSAVFATAGTARVTQVS